jgi:hypothetical protein
LKTGPKIVREDCVLYVAGGYERGKFSDDNDREIEIYYLTYGNHILCTDIYEDDKIIIGVVNVVLGLMS